jgi:hypothetical protein
LKSLFYNPVIPVPYGFNTVTLADAFTSFFYFIPCTVKMNFFFMFQRWNQLSRLQRSTIYLVLSIVLMYIVYMYNQNLPPIDRLKVKTASFPSRDWPPKFGDERRLPDMNGAVTEKANLVGAVDNEEHNAANEEEQDRQQAAQNDVDFDGGDSNNAVENKVEEAGRKGGKEEQHAHKVGILQEEPSGNDFASTVNGSLVFKGPQVKD